MRFRRVGLCLFLETGAAGRRNSHLLQYCHRAVTLLPSALLLLMPAVLPLLLPLLLLLLLLLLLRPVQVPGLSSGAGFIHQGWYVFISLLRKLHQHLQGSMTCTGDVSYVLMLSSGQDEPWCVQGMQGQGEQGQGILG